MWVLLIYSHPRIHFKLSLYIMQNSCAVDINIYQEETSPEALNQLNEQIDKKAIIRNRINTFLNLYKA
jgi:hypothetical protein